MKLLRRKVRTRAFTLIDLIIVLVTIFLLWTFINIGYRPRNRNGHAIIRCVSNLKQIGVAFRIFANDHDEHYPFAVPNLTNEHTGVLLTSNIATAKAWMHFQAISNELQSAKVLICRLDTKRCDNAAEDFLNATNSLPHPAKRDLAVSYFVGLPADETKAEAILAGDRFISATRTRQPYSSVRVGGAIRVSETSTWSDSWPPAPHGYRGNIALADGSVQQMTTEKLQQQLATATNAYGTNINLFLFPQ